MTISMAEIAAWVGSFLWPFFRISMMMMVAPVFSGTYVPVRVRLILGVAVTMLVMPLLSDLPAVSPYSWEGLAIIFQQLLIGGTIGFVLMMVFGVVVTAGQIIAYKMMLGFASMIDPQNGGQAPMVGQLFVLMTTLLFLAMQGHLVLIAMVVESFYIIPVGATGFGRTEFWIIAQWGTQVFAYALWMALPAVVILLTVNISFGIVARASPQMNVFALGMPTSIIMGFFVIYFTLVNVYPQFSVVVEQAYGLINTILLESVNNGRVQ